MSNTSAKVQTLLQTRSEFRRRILDTQTLIFEEQLKTRDDHGEDALDDLKKSVQEASDELFDISIRRRVQELALNRLKLGDTATACLYTSQDVTDKENIIPSSQKQDILNLIREQQHRITLVMQLQDDVEILENELWKLCRKSKELQLSTSKLMADLTNVKAAKKRPAGNEDQVLNRLEGSIKEDLELADTLQQVLLKLIQGSGVNWAADESLLQLVLMLGTPFKLED